MLPDKVKNEIANASKALERKPEELEKKFVEIASQHNFDLEDEDGQKKTTALFRSWFRQQKPVSGTTSTYADSNKEYFGFFLGVDSAVDIQGFILNKAIAEYQRDPEQTYSEGKVAKVELQADGKYLIKLMKDGSEVEVPQDFNPVTIGEENGRGYCGLALKADKGAMHEIGSGQWIVPIDGRKVWNNGQANKAYTKPLPTTQVIRNCVFVATTDGIEYKLYPVSLKADVAKKFSPDTFRWLTTKFFQSGDSLYGVRGSTVELLTYADEVSEDDPDYRDVSALDMGDIASPLIESKQTILVDLERYHQANLSIPQKDRWVVVDGLAANMSMVVNTLGSRTIYLSDINSDFDYDGDGYASTVCWVPSHINIDFGIGSHVVVVGRTNQRQQEDGTMDSVTLNVLGLYVLDRVGDPAEAVESEEVDFDWW